MKQSKAKVRLATSAASHRTFAQLKPQAGLASSASPEVESGYGWRPIQWPTVVRYLKSRRQCRYHNPSCERRACFRLFLGGSRQSRSVRRRPARRPSFGGCIVMYMTICRSFGLVKRPRHCYFLQHSWPQIQPVCWFDRRSVDSSTQRLDQHLLISFEAGPRSQCICMTVPRYHM
jgi:hypothetical protein